MKNYIQTSLVPRIAMLGTITNFEVSSKLHDEMFGVFLYTYHKLYCYHLQIKLVIDRFFLQLFAM